MSTCLTSAGCGGNTIGLYAGRDRAIRITVTTNNPVAGTPLDLTGASIWFGVKQGMNALDEDALILKRNTLAGGNNGEIYIESPATGVMLIYILPIDTIDMAGGKYIYDVVVETSDGKKIEVVPPSEFSVMGIVVRAEDE